MRNNKGRWTKRRSFGKGCSRNKLRPRQSSRYIVTMYCWETRDMITLMGGRERKQEQNSFISPKSERPETRNEGPFPKGKTLRQGGRF